MPMLAVVHVRGGYLYKQQDGENKVYYGKYHLIDNVLYLSFGIVPCVLNSSCDISFGCESAYAEQREQKKRKEEHG